MENPEQLNNVEQLPWITIPEANKKWEEIDSLERQGILGLHTSIGRSPRLIKYKWAKFDELPVEIAKEVAQYWGRRLG